MAKFRLKKLEPSESQIQMSLVTWLRMKKIPHLHIPNEGKRSVATAIWLRSMGLWAGASDLFIARMNGGYGGYWIELKAPGKKPTENQSNFLNKMKEEGYKTDWFDDWEKAKDSIENYLKQ